MNELEIAVHNCRASILKKQLCKGLNTRYCTALNHLLKLGVRENISSPCQELFDIFISESTIRIICPQEELLLDGLIRNVI